MVGWQREDLRSYQDSEWHKHICFSTRPLKDVEQFRRLRAIWSGYTNKRPECLKSMSDIARYAQYLNSQMPLIESKKNRYMRKDKPDLQRLKTQLPRAIRHSQAGFEWKPEKGWLTPTEWAGLALAYRYPRAAREHLAVKQPMVGLPSQASRNTKAHRGLYGIGSRALPRRFRYAC
jgi:hypothetical protein